MKAYDLAPREREAARLAAEGLTNKEVAQAMNLTNGTVRQYLCRAFDKLGVENRGQLVYKVDSLK